MGKRSFKIITGLFGVWALMAQAVDAQVQCDPAQVNIEGGFGQARFSVEVADEAGERAEGLMHRTEMARSAGMLFVFDPPQQVAFWMRNTLIPLDMIFTDRSGTITHIHENAVPLDETPIRGGAQVYTVLEINGGLSSAFGIKPGDQLRHPVYQGASRALACK